MDGQGKDYVSNVIGKNILSQVDSEGFRTMLMGSIVDHMKDEALAVPKSESYIVTRRVQRGLIKSTVGCKLLVCCKDGSDTRVPLK